MPRCLRTCRAVFGKIVNKLMSSYLPPPAGLVTSLFDMPRNCAALRILAISTVLPFHAKYLCCLDCFFVNRKSYVEFLQHQRDQDKQRWVAQHLLSRM